MKFRHLSSFSDMMANNEFITVIDTHKKRIIEYQHQSHLAVFEYDGANGSKNITEVLSVEELYEVLSAMRCILLADDDEFEPYE